MANTTEEQAPGQVGRRLPDAEFVGGHDPLTEESPGKLAVEKAAASPQAAKTLSNEEKADALEWLLADSSDDEGNVTQKWELNVGTADAPKVVEWVIRPIDGDMLNALRTKARAMSGSNRRSRRAAGANEPDFDVTLFSLLQVAAATVSPDLQEAATRKGIATADPHEGPVKLLRQQFRHKPGLIDQLAGSIMLLSGYDEDDVVRTPEAMMVRAAGNSPA